MLYLCSSEITKRKHLSRDKKKVKIQWRKQKKIHSLLWKYQQLMHLLCGARGEKKTHRFSRALALIISLEKIHPFFACLSFSGMDETMSFISLTNSTHCCYFMQKNLCLIFHLRYLCSAELSWAECKHCICYSHNIH